MKKINLEITEEELAMLTAILLAMAVDVRNGMFDDMNTAYKNKAKNAFNDLLTNIMKANFEFMADGLDEVMDAELL